jgi:AcrR family transcriptional regulator
VLTSTDPSARETLLATTIEHLLRSDESELRVLDVCQETGLSTSVIYGHFRSRQGLIDAALLRIYRDVTESMVHQLELAANSVTTSGSFIDALYDQLVDPRLRDVVTRCRQMHLRISATALARPNFRANFLEIYQMYVHHCDRIFGRLINDGSLSNRLTARQWLLFFEGQMLSRAFHDIEAGWNVQSDWREAAQLVDEGEVSA